MTSEELELAKQEFKAAVYNVKRIYNTVKQNPKLTDFYGPVLRRLQDTMFSWSKELPFKEMMKIAAETTTDDAVKIGQYASGQNAVRAAATGGLPLLGKAGAVGAAGVIGGVAGRALGRSGLITDPNYTYDDFYTNLFQRWMEKKK